MASLNTRKNRNRSIQFVDPEGNRKTIRLGKMPKKAAESIKGRIESLLAAKVSNTAIDRDTAAWLAGLGDDLRNKIARAGLAEEDKREAMPTVADFVSRYVASRQDVKSATRVVYGHTERNLADFFGPDKKLDEVTPGDADEFRLYLATTEKLAENTVRRRLGMARQYFNAAKRRKLIDSNPFAGQRVTIRRNRDRDYFITPEETQQLLDTLPDASWRLVVALARYAGLRCPSEIVRMTWGDVDWERMRFTVHSPKTEHHDDGGERIVPIFPELAPYLLEAFEQAEDGQEYCCPQYENAGPMYRKIVKAAMRRASLSWSKTFQNMRASRETELVQSYPVHVAAAWLGHSPAVAANHYLQVREEDFASAAADCSALHNALQYGPAGASQGTPEQKKVRRKPDRPTNEKAPSGRGFRARGRSCQAGANSLQSLVSMGVTGLEPVTSSL